MLVSKHALEIVEKARKVGWVELRKKYLSKFKYKRVRERARFGGKVRVSDGIMCYGRGRWAKFVDVNEKFEVLKEVNQQPSTVHVKI